ncbi:chromatin remodeling protein SHL [Rosa sericea]
MTERGKKRYAKQYTVPNSEVTVKVMGFSNGCSVGDYVLSKAERGKIPYIARIHQIYIRCGDVSREVHLKVQWFYRPEDTQMKRVSFNGKNELYKSNRYDYDFQKTKHNACQTSIQNPNTNLLLHRS